VFVRWAILRRMGFASLYPSYALRAY
jgi:hypothetical protein